MTLGEVIDVVAEWFPQATAIQVTGERGAYYVPPFEISVAIMTTEGAFVARRVTYDPAGDLRALLSALDRQLVAEIGERVIVMRPGGPSKHGPAGYARSRASDPADPSD